MTTIITIALTELEIHPEMKDLRGVDMKWVNKLHRDFNPDALGLPKVARRSGGGYWLIDGAHRAEVLRLMGWTHVMCEIVDGVPTPEEIARTFLNANESRDQHTLVRWHMAVLARDPETLAIVAKCADWGFSVPRSPRATDGHITCVHELRKAYQRGVLDNVLRVLREGFDGAWKVSQTWFISGLSLVLARRPGMDIDRLIAKLQEKGGIWLKNRYNVTKDVSSGYAATVMANVIIEAYNSGLRSGARVVPRIDEKERTAFRDVTRRDTHRWPGVPLVDPPPDEEGKEREVA